MSDASPASPTPTPTTKPRRGCLARLVRLGLWTFALCVLIGTGLYFTRDRTLAPAAIALAQRIAGEALHGELEIEAIEGGWWSDITLRGVSFTRTGDAGPLVRLERGEVTATYSIPDFLRGETGWLSTATVTAADLELDLTGGEEAEGEGAGPSETVRTLFARPPAVTLDVERLRVHQGTSRLVTLEDLAVTTPTAGAAPRFAIETSSFSVTGETPEIAPTPLAATLDYDAGRIAIDGLTLGSTCGVRTGTVDLQGLFDGRLAWDLALAIGEREGVLTGSLDDERIAARAELVDVRLEDLAPFLPAEGGTPPVGLFTVRADADLPRDPATQGAVRLDVTGRDVVVAERVFEDLSLSATLIGDRLQVDELIARGGPNRLVARDLAVSLGAGDAIAMLRTAAGRIEVDVPDVPTWAGTARRDELSATLPPHRIELSARMADGVFDLTTGRVVTAGGTFDVRRGRIALGTDPDRLVEDGTLDVDFAVAFADLGPLGELLGYPDWAGTLDGALTLRGGLTAPDGELEGRARDVRAFGIALDEMTADVGLSTTDDAQPVLEVRDLALASPHGRARLHGRVVRGPDAIEARLDGIEAVRDTARLDLQDPIVVTIEDARVSVSPFVLTGELGRAAGSIERTPERTTGHIALTAFDWMPLVGPFLPVGVVLSPCDAQVEVDFADDALRVDANVAMAELTPFAGSPPWAIDVRGRLDGDVLHLDHAAGTQDQLGAWTIAGTVPCDPLGAELLPAGPLALTVHVEANDFPRWPAPWRERLPWIEGRGRLDADLTGTWRAPRGTIEVELVDARVSEAERLETELGPLAARVALQLGATRHAVSGKVEAPGIGTAHIAGTVAAPLDVPALLAEGAASLPDANLDLAAQVDVADIGWTARHLDVVRRIEGRLAGEVTLAGPATSPQLGGHIAMDAGELRLTTAFPAMRSLEGRATFADDAVRLERFTGEFGGAPFVLAGTLDLADEEPRLAATLEGEGLLLYRTSDTIVRADAHLAANGPLSTLHFTGALDLTDGRFGRDINLLGSLRGDSAPPSAHRGLELSMASDPPLSDATFDVAIRAREPFVLRNNLIQGSLRPDLVLGGTGEVLELRGRVYLDETRVSLPSGRMTVPSGLVVFAEDDPFVPRLELNGEARIKGYDLRARISGAYDDPEIELSSTPPLPGEDLAILFLTGQLPEGSSRERGAGAAQSVAMYVAQDALLRWFSGDGLDEDESFFERFDIQVGAEISKSGAATVRVEYSLDERARERRRSRYLVGERDEYDHINFGYGVRFRFR